jgi:hypothetical protein
VIALADYDGDGKVDVFLGGHKQGSDTTGIFYRNMTSDPNIAPYLLQTEIISVYTDSARIGWIKSYDTDSRTKNLYYNLRMGTSPGGTDIVSPLSFPDGSRKIANKGNMDQATMYTIRDLNPSTTYYFAIQVIDQSLAPSAWSGENSFTTLINDVEEIPVSCLNVKVYPVPAHDQLTLEILSDKVESMTLEIFDESGRCVQSMQIPAEGNHTLTDIRLPGMGLYMLRLTQGVDIVMKKVVVTR